MGVVVCSSCRLWSGTFSSSAWGSCRPGLPRCGEGNCCCSENFDWTTHGQSLSSSSRPHVLGIRAQFCRMLLRPQLVGYLSAGYYGRESIVLFNLLLILFMNPGPSICWYWMQGYLDCRILWQRMDMKLHFRRIIWGTSFSLSSWLQSWRSQPLPGLSVSRQNLTGSHHVTLSVHSTYIFYFIMILCCFLVQIHWFVRVNHLWTDALSSQGFLPTYLCL